MAKLIISPIVSCIWCPYYQGGYASGVCPLYSRLHDGTDLKISNPYVLSRKCPLPDADDGR